MAGQLVSPVLLLLGAFLLPCSRCKPPSAAPSLRFMVVGDWGGKESAPYYTEAEKEVAEAMGLQAAALGSQFTLGLGDNFYENGVSDVDDKRFQETFEDVFTAKSLQSRWYVVCGNHDHLGNVSAQVAYTNRSDRWFMPDLYYTQVVSIPGTSSTVQFVFIDTILLAGITDPTNRSLKPEGPRSRSAADEQWDWINATLVASKADWVIMAGHYPVWSMAKHGPTEVLVERLKPLLEQHNVSAYFSGHDHNLQYIQEADSNVSYFVVGAGHLTDPSDDHKHDIPSHSLKFWYAKKDKDESHGGFATVSITSTNMTINFLTKKDGGHQLFSVTRSRTRTSRAT